MEIGLCDALADREAAGHIPTVIYSNGRGRDNAQAEGECIICPRVTYPKQ